jgi:hypothetical protein
MDDYEAEPEAESLALDEPATADEMAPETDESPTDEFDMEADAALNTALPMSERRVALKNAIMACMGTDYGAEKEKGKGGDDMFSALLGKG